MGRKKKVDVPESEWKGKAKYVPEWRIVPEELWNAVRGRLDATKAQYIRWTDGKLFGRPSSGVWSEYLLTGIGVCGKCGGSLTVRTKGRGQGRATYQCLTHSNRGSDICSNGLKMDLQDAEGAVRGLFENILRPDVMVDVVTNAVARLRPSLAAQDTRRAELRRELVQLEGQITNLTDAVALGAPDEPIPALLGAIKDRERRCDRIRDELVQLEQLDQVAELDAAVLQRALEKLLAEWRSWVGGRPHQARQILQKLVVGRLVFTPKTEDGTVFYEFSGVGALGSILAGVLPTRVKRWCPRAEL